MPIAFWVEIEICFPHIKRFSWKNNNKSNIEKTLSAGNFAS